MEKKTSSRMIKRLIILATVFQVILMIFIYAFTKNIFYSIISFLGAIIGIVSFLVMIMMTDMILLKKRGLGFFSLVALSKVIVISLLLFLVYRVSRQEILYPLLGFSCIAAAIGMEGVYQLFRSGSKNLNKNMNKGVSNGRT